MVVGDLNSSYWHPDFRDLLDAGFVDAHIANGKGFSASWPTDMIGPAFVRLDHALTTGGLVSTDVADFEIPGSDHRGFVVTVAPTPLSNERKARPRCEMAFFASGPISANVAPPPSSGWNTES